jgi:hypothetical protein
MNATDTTEFAIVSRTDTDTLSVITVARSIFNPSRHPLANPVRKMVYTVISTPDGFDMIVDPIGRHIDANRVDTDGAMARLVAFLVEAV